MANPNKLFSWLKYQDIQIPDVTLRSQFESLMNAGSYSQALTLLSNNRTQLSGKAWIGDTINTIANGILAVENLYGDNVIKYLSDLAISLQSLVDNYRNMNDWVSTRDYKAMNFVAYDEIMYMALKDVPAGTPTQNTNYWLRVGLRGEQGAAGVNVRQQYDYSSSKSYNVNDIVVYQGQLYVAKVASTGVVPTDSNRWLIYERVVKGDIYVSNTAPTTNLIEGKIWFKTQSNPYTYTGGAPIIGTFMLYHEEDTWEEMYPDTIYEWVEDKDQYSEYGSKFNALLDTFGWNNKSFTYIDFSFKTDSYVTIIPTIDMDEEQWKQYCWLDKVYVSDGSVEITSTKDITIDLPVTFIIR